MYENLQLGDTGDRVKTLQEKLKILNLYNPVISGSFGLATEEGVRLFQRQVGLEETGIVDYATWERLNEYTENPIATISVYPTLSYGDTGNYVRDLQTKLKALLYYPGEINSNFDLETETAVKRFQLNNELTSSGTVNSETWNLLNNLYGNLNSCVLDNDDNGNGESTENQLTYTVVRGDRIFMGNNE